MFKVFFLINFLVVNCVFANAPVGCDISIAYSMQNEGSKDAYHTTSISGKIVSVGGKEHKYADNIDFLAAQRSLLYCSAAMIQCFIDKKISDPVNMSISFQLQKSETKPTGDFSKASQVDIKWMTNKKLTAAEGCLKKLVSDISFGLVVKAPAAMTVPVKIEN
tara:strand:- start:35923 stop:36411 length:489 start_codon:yes stop_codon:yes gene_type:complete